MLVQFVFPSPSNVRLSGLLKQRWCLCFTVLPWPTWLSRPGMAAAALLTLVWSPAWVNIWQIGPCWTLWCYLQCCDDIRYSKVQVGCAYRSHKHHHTSCEVVTGSRDRWLWIAVSGEIQVEVSSLLSYRPNYDHLSTFWQVLSAEVSCNLGNVGRAQTELGFVFLHVSAHHYKGTSSNVMSLHRQRPPQDYSRAVLSELTQPRGPG